MTYENYSQNNDSGRSELDESRSVLPIGERAYTSSTEKILQINWNDHFPLKLGTEGCSIEYASAVSGLSFLAKNYSTIHELNLSRQFFLNEGMTPAKTRYYEEFGDFFMIKKNGYPLGVLVGTLNDWSSYYFRDASFLEDIQAQGIASRLVAYILDILKSSGVLRVESDVSPENFTSIQVLLRARFKISGVNLSDRWVSIVKFSKYLDSASDEIFLRQFCGREKK